MQMQRHRLLAAALVFFVLSCATLFLREHESMVGNDAVESSPPQDQRSRELRIADLSDPKTVTPRVSVNRKDAVTIYITKERRDLKFEDSFNEALSIFTTGMLQRYGTGRVQYTIRERAECPPCAAAPALPPPAPCLAVSRHSKRMLCDVDLLRCNYPRCKTMVTNDEFCTKIDLPFDAREYYTSARPELGYLPIGPRWDSWASMQRIQAAPGFFVLPASKRKYAFNAIFSRSTNSDRKELAKEIERRARDFPVFAAMADEWDRDANAESTKQVSTDDYMGVLLDSVFTLSPAGHSPECFRLFEAAEAGSIPITTRGDLHGARHPDRDRRKDLREAPHPCKDPLRHWHDAPMVVLDSWGDLYPTVEGLLRDPAALDERQAAFHGWYQGYMRLVMAEFEDFVVGRHPTAA